MKTIQHSVEIDARRTAKLVQTSTGIYIIGIMRVKNELPRMHFEIAYIFDPNIKDVGQDPLFVLRFISQLGITSTGFSKDCIVHNLDVWNPAIIFHLGDTTSEYVMDQLRIAAK